MGRLSNFGRSVRPRPADTPPSQPAPPPQLVARPARPEELPVALRLALGTGGAPADAEHVEHFVRFAEMRGIDVRQAWVVARPVDPYAPAGVTVSAAVLPVISPGRTMLLLGGGVPPHAEAAGQLIEAVCGHFAGRGIQLAQVLLDPADESARRLYERAGFRRIAQLLYLQAQPRRRPAAPALPGACPFCRIHPRRTASSPPPSRRRTRGAWTARR